MERRVDRHLNWDGCLNVRDLGGLARGESGRTRWRSVVRSDNPAYLTDAGWSSLEAYGVRTIVALRTNGADDDEPDASRVPPSVRVQRVVVEDGTDADFVSRCVVTGLFGTPLYFAEMLQRWPTFCAAGVRAVARAEPGGVVLACGRGCDRTGLVTFLLLAIAGVAADDIAHDWLLSVERLGPRDPTYEGALAALLEREGTTAQASIASALDRFDVAERLRAGGLSEDDLTRACERLVGDPAGV